MRLPDQLRLHSSEAPEITVSTRWPAMEYELKRFFERLASDEEVVVKQWNVADRERCCPVCGKPMEVVEEEGVHTDVCPAHGVWLDLDELRLIISRVRIRSMEKGKREVRKARRTGVWIGANHGIWRHLLFD